MAFWGECKKSKDSAGVTRFLKDSSMNTATSSAVSKHLSVSIPVIPVGLCYRLPGALDQDTCTNSIPSRRYFVV